MLFNCLILQFVGLWLGFICPETVFLAWTLLCRSLRVLTFYAHVLLCAYIAQNTATIEQCCVFFSFRLFSETILYKIVFAAFCNLSVDVSCNMRNSMDVKDGIQWNKQHHPQKFKECFFSYSMALSFIKICSIYWDLE